MFALLAHTKSSTVTLTSLFEQHDAKHTAKNHEADNSFCACPQIYVVFCPPLCPLPALATSLLRCRQQKDSEARPSLTVGCTRVVSCRRVHAAARTIAEHLAEHLARWCCAHISTHIQHMLMAQAEQPQKTGIYSFCGFKGSIFWACSTSTGSPDENIRRNSVDRTRRNHDVERSNVRLMDIVGKWHRYCS